MDYSQFNSIIKSGTCVHLSGIGGVSMSALAAYLHARGVCVQGSDRSESAAVQKLRSLGIRVFIGQHESNIAGASLVIRTAAIPDSNAEIAAARGAGIPVLERAEAWGFIMRGYKNAVCVAGTHGKTTVTGMISLVALEAKTDPVIMIGGDLAQIGGTLREGAGKLIIAETCEYKNSFLSFYPSIALVLNIDDDHMDFFKNSDDIIASFRRFVALTPESGVVILNRDDERTMLLADGLPRNILTFGTDNRADIYAENLAHECGLYRFDVMRGTEKYAAVRLNVPGRHSVSNVLAAAAAAISLGVSGEDFTRGIESFTGVGRRFEFKKHWRGSKVYDDYAHHPNEIAVSIETARSLNPKRLICVFQPHTYTRTRAFMHEFAQALSMSDEVILCPIFEARELPIDGVNSEVLSALIHGSRFAPSLESAAEMLSQEVREGDLVLLMGAGDVNRISDML